MNLNIFNKTNHQYVIVNDIDLEGHSISVGANSSIIFKGGIIKNGTIIGNNTMIIASDFNIFINVTLQGTFKNEYLKADWFIINTNNTLTSSDWNNFINYPIDFNNRNLLITEDIEIRNGVKYKNLNIRCKNFTIISNEDVSIISSKFIISSKDKTISVKNSSRLNIENCYFSSSSGCDANLKVENVSGGKISNCTFEYSYYSDSTTSYGLYLKDTTHLFVKYNKFRTCLKSLYIIGTTNSSYNLILNNNFELGSNIGNTLGIYSKVTSNNIYSNNTFTQYYEKELDINGIDEIDLNNISIKRKNKGESINRPILSNTNQGFQYYDTTLNKPIWWTGEKWVDATGAQV